MIATRVVIPRTHAEEAHAFSSHALQSYSAPPCFPSPASRGSVAICNVVLQCREPSPAE